MAKPKTPPPSAPAVVAVPIEGTVPALPMVRYRGSVLRPDGGWDVIDIAVPATATGEEIAQAIAAWGMLREHALAQVRAVNRRWGEQTNMANPTLILTFGKYAGRSLAEIVQADRGYVEWLATEGRDEEVKVSARYLLNLADAIVRTQALAETQAAIEESGATSAVFDETAPF